MGDDDREEPLFFPPGGERCCCGDLASSNNNSDDANLFCSCTSSSPPLLWEVVVDFLRKNILDLLPLPFLFVPAASDVGRAMALFLTSSSSNNNDKLGSISVTTSSSQTIRPRTLPSCTCVSRISTCDPGGTTRFRVMTLVVVLIFLLRCFFFFFLRFIFIFFEDALLLSSLVSLSLSTMSDFLIILRFTMGDLRCMSVVTSNPADGEGQIIS
mmetsp:Transcript_12091/g.21839  ORF Transcript_12091/g.21839 Transcript_12091/m.21839 type:complete len:213 (-) Transcript_12091:859-1497(-)